MIEVPDRFRPLLGVRQYLLIEGGGIASPNRAGYYWGSGWKVAECSPGTVFKRLDFPHKSPHADCCCGIQVGYSLDILWREGTIRNNALYLKQRNNGTFTGGWDLGGEGQCVVFYALVAASGFVRKFDNLMKAEKVRILSVVQPPVKYIAGATIEPRDAEFLALSYGIGYMDLRKAPDISSREMKAMAPIFNCDYWSPEDTPVTLPRNK